MKNLIDIYGLHAKDMTKSIFPDCYERVFESGMILNHALVVLGYKIDDLLKVLNCSLGMYNLYLYYYFKDEKILDKIISERNDKLVVTLSTMNKSTYNYLYNDIIKTNNIKVTGYINKGLVKKFNLKMKMLKGVKIYTREEIKNLLNDIVKKNEDNFINLLSKDVEYFLFLTRDYNIEGKEKLERYLIKDSHGVPYIKDDIERIKRNIGKKSAIEIFEELLLTRNILI